MLTSNKRVRAGLIRVPLPRAARAAQPKIADEEESMEKNRIVTIPESEFIQMRGVVMDRDGAEALKLLKKLVKRLEEEENRGLKSHLG